MKSREVWVLFRETQTLDRDFADSKINQGEFLDGVSRLQDSLLAGGAEMGIKAIVRASRSLTEAAKNVGHEVIHLGINALCGVPVRGVGAIKAELDDGHEIWPFATMDIEKARGVLDLRRRFSRAQKFHDLLDGDL